MRKQIGKLIPDAVAAVREHIAMDTERTKVNEAFGGYAAAYCSTIEQCGLLAATAMFSDLSKTSKTKGDKTCLMQAILYMLQKSDPTGCAYLFEYVQEGLADEYLLKRRILDAAIAIKLVLRTFQQVKSKDHES